MIIDMSNKDHVVLQHKAQRMIMTNACKQVVIMKVNGLKPFFVTCDASRKPKPPHQNVWVNMLLTSIIIVLIQTLTTSMPNHIQR
jgi:hypothetical protein